MTSFGNSYYFSNVDSSRIDFTPGCVLGSTATIMVWFNLDPACSNNQIWFIQDTSNYMGDMYYEARITLSAGNTYLNSYAACAGGWKNNWHHQAIVNDGSSISVYNDGVYVEPSTSTNYNYASFSGFNFNHIGNTAGWGSNGFNGYLDDVVVLSTSLSASQVKSLYDAGKAGVPFRTPI